MGMIEQRGRPGFALEPNTLFFRSDGLFREDLEGYGPLGPGIIRLINNTHPPLTQRVQDLILIDRLAFHCSRL